MTTPRKDLSRVILDEGRGVQERREAMEELATADPASAVQALLQIGKRATEQAQIVRAAGTELARLSHLGNEVSEFDLRNLTEIAYQAYCDWVPPD
jgi:hypothetical protein